MLFILSPIGALNNLAYRTNSRVISYIKLKKIDQIQLSQYKKKFEIAIVLYSVIFLVIKDNKKIALKNYSLKK